MSVTSQAPTGLAEDTPSASSVWARLARLAMANPAMPLLLVAIPLFVALVPGYATAGNMRNVLLQSAVLALLVVGVGVVLLTGNFDLSPEGTLAFSAVLGGWLMATDSPGSGFGLNPVLVILLMVAAGAGIGAINGVLVTLLRVNPFIVTLAMFLTLKGAASIPTRAQTVVGLPDVFSWVGRADFLGLSMIVVIAVVIYVAVALAIRFTVFGRHAYAVGGDQWAARENGVRTNAVVIGTYMISGALAGVAGWLSAARLDSASASLGDGIIFTAYAALVIGGVSLSGGSGNLLAGLGAVFLLGSISNVINLLAVSPLYANFIRGAVLLVAVLIIALRYRLADRIGLVEKAP